MAQKKKQIDGTANTVARRSKVSTAEGSRRVGAGRAPRSPAGRSVADAGPGVANGAGADKPQSFEAILNRVIGMALAVLPEQRRPSMAPPNANDDASSSRAPEQGRESIRPGPTAQQLLTQALEMLEPEMALKLRTLMVAGRDGRSVSAVHVNMTLASADSAFAAAARDSSENGPLLADYLRRGHAMACAAGLDIERPVSEWPSVAPQSLEERAWQSFGRQLAMSQPEDWKCVGFVAPNHAEQLTKLYLKLEDRAWWSFQSLLDRPSASSVDKQKKARKGARAKAVATGSLKVMANRGSGNEGRALRRAVRAIRARIGDLEGAA